MATLYTVQPQDAPILRTEKHALLEKRVIEVVLSEDRESDFYSRYFLVPKKDWCPPTYFGFETIELCSVMLLFLNDHRKTNPRTHSTWELVNFGRYERHLLPHSDGFLRFSFEGMAYQFLVLNYVH